MKTTINSLIRTTAIASAAIVMMAAVARADIVQYNTNATGTAGTGFNVSGNLTLNNSGGGAAATLVYTPNGNTTTGTPSNVNLGNFVLACPFCGTQALGPGATFGNFKFNLVISDVTDGATGEFVGTSTGGNVWSNVSQLSITWFPLQLGPGTNHALTGSFGPTAFTTTTFTGLAAPNSGGGLTTVQGYVVSTPEPSALGLLGGALLVLGMVVRKRTARP